MTTKERVLKLFEAHKGAYFSGEEMAQTLAVSRAAIWKAVNALRQEGYAIDAATNRGYCLSEDNDILSRQGIAHYLKGPGKDLRLQVLPSVDSTNSALRELANRGEPEGLVLLAGAQSAGRGRLGRSFYSPAGSGVYLSILLRPAAFAPAQAVRITTMAAVAMCEAIEAVAETQARIKWVNDIFVDGKKVCGILTEGAFSMESGLLDYAVLGVGVNVCPPEHGFPEELQQIAGAVFSEGGHDRKNRLTAAFLDRFMAYYRMENPAIYTERYRAYSLVIGKKITVFSPAGSRPAVATGIDDQCHLQVRYDDGTEETLSYGEIKIQL